MYHSMKINVKVLKKKKKEKEKSTDRPKILIFPLEGKQTYFFFWPYSFL